MTNDSVFSHFNEKEVEEFRKMLVNYSHCFLMKTMLRELSNLYGEFTQSWFWKITSSEIWKALCRRYGSEVTNKALKQFMQVMLFDAQCLISALETVLYQEVTEKLDEEREFIEKTVDLTDFENFVKALRNHAHRLNGEK